MKQEKNTVQFSEIRSKGCNDIEMLERFLHGIVETATSKLRQRKLKTTEISIRLVHAKSENRLPLEFTFSIKPTSSSVIIYTEVIKNVTQVGEFKVLRFNLIKIPLPLHRKDLI